MMMMVRIMRYWYLSIDQEYTTKKKCIWQIIREAHSYLNGLSYPFLQPDREHNKSNKNAEPLISLTTHQVFIKMQVQSKYKPQYRTISPTIVAYDPLHTCYYKELCNNMSKCVKQSFDSSMPNSQTTLEAKVVSHKFLIGSFNLMNIIMINNTNSNHSTVKLLQSSQATKYIY